MMQFDKKKLLMSLLENASSPWGQFWERVLHKHKCIQITARQLQTVQVLANDYQMLIFCLSYFIISVKKE